MIPFSDSLKKAHSSNRFVPARGWDWVVGHDWKEECGGGFHVGEAVLGSSAMKAQNHRQQSRFHGV